MHQFMLFLMKVDSSVSAMASYEMDDRGLSSTLLQSVQRALRQLSYLPVTLAGSKR